MKYRDFVSGVAFLLVLASCCAGVFWFVLHSKETQQAEKFVAFASLKGSAAPAFSVTTLDGKHISPQKRAKPLVVEVFATWCEICTSEIPVLNHLTATHPDVDVVAVTGSKKGANFEPESRFDLERYRSQRKVRYSIAFDPTIGLTRDYKVVGFPSIYVIDRNGKITFNEAGAVSFAALDEAVKEASLD